MIKDYLKLAKFKYHISFASVIAGALFFADKITFSLLLSIVLVYISSTLLMYTGLYTINDIADYHSDRAHPVKRNRVIASGKISLSSAKLFAAITIILGLLISFFAFRKLFYFYPMFIALNIFYSFFAKKIPYLDLAANSITHPLRFIMGAALVGAIVPTNLIFAYFFAALGIATARRRFEMCHEGYEARKVLKKYSQKKLYIIELFSFIMVLVFMLVYFPENVSGYSFLLVFYVFFVFVLGHGKKFRPFLTKLWLH